MNDNVPSPPNAQPPVGTQPINSASVMQPNQPQGQSANMQQPLAVQPVENSVQQASVTPQEAGANQQVITTPQQAPPDTSDNPKITLQDLYGPSEQVQQPVMPPQAPSVSTTPLPKDNTTSQPLSENTQGHIRREEITPIQEANSAASIPRPFSQEKKEDISDAGGFHFPPMLIKLIGGLLVLLIIIFLVSLVSSFFTKPPDNGKVTLTYWGLWEDTNVFQGVLDDFHREYPNITVVYSKQDPVKYTDRLITRIQNGNGPDIFRFHNTWVYPLESILTPLPSSVIDKKQLDGTYFPVVDSDLVKNGAIYGIPLEMDDLVLFINKDVFDHAGAKVPTTWEDFITVAKGLTVKDDTGHIKTSGAAIGTYDNIEHAPDILSLLLLQNGANLQKLDSSQNANDALTFYTSFSRTDDRVWDSTLDNSLQAFIRGKVAMYFGYSYDYFAIKAAAPQLNFEIHPVPHLPGRDMSIASYWVEGVSNKSKHQKEALLFLKYLSQKDVVAKLYSDEAKTRQFGEIYARKDLANSLSTDPVLSSFVNQADKAVSSFFVSDTNFVSFNDALNQYLGNAINSMSKDSSVDSALSTVAQGVSQVFNQYGNSSQ